MCSETRPNIKPENVVAFYAYMQDMKVLTNRIIYLIFWSLFFGFFFYKLIPKLIGYAAEGLPDFMGQSFFDKHFWFALHILFGTMVYIIGLIQFTPYIRNNYIRLHRALGKIYIASSLLCILSLYFILPDNACHSCKISQYIVTNLWLVFIVLAYYLIKQKRIAAHQQMMVRTYICAVYFVTIRVVDKYLMAPFVYVFKDESDQFLYSDIFVWLFPLLVFEAYWRISSRKKQWSKI